MPELPDIEVYAECLRRRCVGQAIRSLSVRGPSLLRTFEPPPEAVAGRVVASVTRLGKRLILTLEPGMVMAIHLMIAGRLQWRAPGARPASKIDQAALAFPQGTLVLTEASTRKRAALHLFADASGLAALDPAGIEPLTASLPEFTRVLTARRRTLKRALTDPASFRGIGNAYSDEILHAARLSPVSMTTALDPDELARLHGATRSILTTWRDRLFHEFELDRPGPGRFPGPGDITAFRPDFAVHGRYTRPCPVCGVAVQRIVRAENESNYCPLCQTGGKVLADRALSRLLGDDWPRTPEEWDETVGPSSRPPA